MIITIVIINENRETKRKYKTFNTFDSSPRLLGLYTNTLEVDIHLEFNQ